MKKILLLVLTAALITGAVGCAKSSVSDDHEKIGIRGQITKVVSGHSTIVSTVLVEGKVEDDTVYDKASVGIDKDTGIFKGRTKQEMSIGDLKEGMKVEVVFEGAVAESYPVQGKARTIRVID